MSACLADGMKPRITNIIIIRFTFELTIDYSHIGPNKCKLYLLNKIKGLFPRRYLKLLQIPSISVTFKCRLEVRMWGLAF